MAKKIGVSPTYLSKVERDEFPPPAEDKVRKIAGIIGQDVDELLALAGRVASDLTDIIRERPREMADFLRAAKGLTAHDMARLARQAQKSRQKSALPTSGGPASHRDHLGQGRVRLCGRYDDSELPRPPAWARISEAVGVVSRSEHGGAR